MKLTKHFDLGSLIVIWITFALFVVALFVKGLANDLLLEAGVFLVSVKLIMMSHKSSVGVGELTERLANIEAVLKQRKGQARASHS